MHHSKIHFRLAAMDQSRNSSAGLLCQVLPAADMPLHRPRRMRDFLISQLQDGHAAVRFVILVTMLIATICLATDGREKAVR